MVKGEYCRHDEYERLITLVDLHTIASKKISSVWHKYVKFYDPISFRLNKLLYKKIKQIIL